MLDLQSLPWPLYLIIVLVFTPLSLLQKLYKGLMAPRPISPNIAPSSYTPLPPTLISPPLSIPYSHHFVTTSSSRVHYISTAKPDKASDSGIALFFVHGFPDFVRCSNADTAQTRHTPHHGARTDTAALCVL
jgi:hypothetical protein